MLYHGREGYFKMRARKQTLQEEIVVVPSLSHVWLCSLIAACQASLSTGVCPSSCALNQWFYPTVSSSATLFFCLLSFPASVSFPVRWVLRIRWPKYWSFSFSLSNECSGSIFFRIDWFYLLAVQGILQSLLQHYIWRWMASLGRAKTGLSLRVTAWNGEFTMK